MAALATLRSITSRLLHEEEGQDTFEYVLIIGGVVVAVIVAITTPIGSSLINAVVHGVCGAIQEIPGMTVACTSS